MSDIGYLAVVLPDRNFYQGYFIKDVFTQEAERALQSIRSDEKLRTGSTVFANFDGAEVDQSIVGSLCATIVDAIEANRDQTIIGVCGCALRMITGRDYFWIEARTDDKGIWTTITPSAATTIPEARAAIESLSIVQTIKRRLLDMIR